MSLMGHGQKNSARAFLVRSIFNNGRLVAPQYIEGRAISEKQRGVDAPAKVGARSPAPDEESGRRARSRASVPRLPATSSEKRPPAVSRCCGHVLTVSAEAMNPERPTVKAERKGHLGPATPAMSDRCSGRSHSRGKPNLSSKSLLPPRGLIPAGRGKLGLAASLGLMLAAFVKCRLAFAFCFKLAIALVDRLRPIGAVNPRGGSRTWMIMGGCRSGQAY
jgi:hypothetical protein